MPRHNREAQGRADEGRASEAALQSEIVLGGELGCLLVYSDRRHVGYINALLSQLESVLRRRGFKAQRLGEEIRSAEDYLDKLTDLIRQSVLGLVVLDGFRPNVLFEFGFLLGKGKPTILLMCKGACVSVKTLYASVDESGLSQRSFDLLLHDPPIDLARHLSDLAGKHIAWMDWGGVDSDPDHPAAVLARELDKSEDSILEEARRVVARDMPPADLGLLLTPLVTVVRQYYMDPRRLNLNHLRRAHDELLELAAGRGVQLPYDVYTMMGGAYLSRASLAPQNAAHAVTCLESALDVHSRKAPSALMGQRPAFRADNERRIGDIHLRLAQYRERGDNCKRAITAYTKALRVQTLLEFPMEYGMTRNNLGTAYSTLAEVEDKAGNCKKAIAAHKEALRVHTLEEFPMDYAMTQNNLGNAYRTLAEVEDQAGNCKKAIAAYDEALRVRTPEDFPMHYGMTQNNLGNAYSTLAEVEEKAENCKRAIAAHEEALRVRTLEDFPMQYGMTQDNLGTAYRTLAEVEDKGGNCRRAVAAYREALSVYTEEQFPEVHNLVVHNLAYALEGVCAEEGAA